MAFEIELKVKVDSHESVIKRLREIGAMLLRNEYQVDHYYDDSSSTMLNSDKALRIRKTRTGNEVSTLLTFKGPKLKDELKYRKEIETLVNDPDAMDRILCELGFKTSLTVEKKREQWSYGQCLVMLDSLPLLGKFVEIEGPDTAAIHELQQKLGIDDRPHIDKGYAVLLKEAQE